MGMVEPVIRPPSEADSFLLQVTLGCSAPQCVFCGAYQNKKFRVKDMQEIMADIERHARDYPATRRVFLMDGDALVLSTVKLLNILQMLNRVFPRLSRVSSYANGSNLVQKSLEELKTLYEQRLSLVYMGLESGSQVVLNRCRKTSSVEEMIEAVQKASEANIKSSVIVLLGLGGKKYSGEHVSGTIAALNKMQPRYLSLLSLMVIPGTPLAEELKRGEFQELNARELLKEAYEMIKGLQLKGTIFRSNHASNYLSLEGTFPKDKDALLASLEAALAGKVRLRPEFVRGL